MYFRFYFLLTVLCACSVSNRYHADGTTSTHFALGPADRIACSAEDFISGDTTSFGIWAGPDGSGLGYAHERFACGPPVCQVVIWAEPGLDIARLQEAAGDLDDICIIN